MKTTVLLIISSLLFGCASTVSFNHTPVTSEDFSRSYSEITQEYLDVAEYEKWFRGPAKSPNVSELVEAWGEPDVKKKNWFEYAVYLSLFLVLGSVDDYPHEALPFLFALNPLPKEQYIWNKGRHEIVVSGRNDALVKYQKRVYSWKWEDRN